MSVLPLYPKGIPALLEACGGERVGVAVPGLNMEQMHEFNKLRC